MAKSATRMGQERQFSNQAPAISSGSNIPSIQFSTGNAEALAQFSRNLFGLSARFEDQLDEQAEAEASKEGALAGLAGNTEEQTYETIRGRAYNKAMLETFVTSLDTKAMLGAQRISNQYYNDPVKQEQALNDFFGGMAEEIDKVAPGAGASFRARQTARAIQNVEQARDVRFKMTRDEADAAMIEYETSLLGVVKNNASGLFSSNPAVSSAASASLTQAVGEYMRTYDAVDPVTGKPLYTASEKAKARVYMRDKVMAEATLAWFDAQEDKVAAYQRLQDPEFKFNINIPEEKPAPIHYENQGATRRQKVQPQVEQWLGVAARQLGPNVAVHITSGGQPTAEEIRLSRLRGVNVGGRTGSTRHDHGNAADVVLSVNGKKVTPAQNPELYRRFAENAAAAGATGIGHYSWGVHIGGGSESVWGPDTTSGTLDPEFGEAVARGRSRRGKSGTIEPQSLALPIRQAMSEASFAKLDTEMRARISFENQQHDRAQRAENDRVKSEQERNALEITTRIFAEGKDDPATGQKVQPVSEMEVRQLAYEGLLSPAQAQSFIKAISAEKPDRSDPSIYKELQRRLWSGENIQEDVLANADVLSQSDANALLSKNNELNLASQGRMTPEENWYYDQLEKLLTPDTMFASFDTDRQERKFNAMLEYNRRIRSRSETGETLEQIVEDIKGRAVVDMASIGEGQLSRLVLPKFSVRASGQEGRMIDIPQSAKSLADAHARKQISDEEFERNKVLLQQWAQAQDQYLKDQANVKGRKK